MRSFVSIRIGWTYQIDTKAGYRLQLIIFIIKTFVRRWQRAATVVKPRWMGTKHFSCALLVWNNFVLCVSCEGFSMIKTKMCLFTLCRVRVMFTYNELIRRHLYKKERNQLHSCHTNRPIFFPRLSLQSRMWIWILDGRIGAVLLGSDAKKYERVEMIIIIVIMWSRTAIKLPCCRLSTIVLHLLL